MLLNGLNLAVFVTAKRGTWRDRLPSIFVDIARVLLIVVGLAILFGWIWGADIGGLFTALGISTIVIGLALQNAVGAVLSGLFLLFEQPFELGDYLDTGSGKGRIVAVNWRATHIDTGNGILIIPNGTLAGATFRNLSACDESVRGDDDREVLDRRSAAGGHRSGRRGGPRAARRSPWGRIRRSCRWTTPSTRSAFR